MNPYHKNVAKSKLGVATKKKQQQIARRNKQKKINDKKWQVRLRMVEGLGVSEEDYKKYYTSKRQNCPFKIFQIGFNKCGTNSISYFFKWHGYRTIHWDFGLLAHKMDKNFQKGKPLLDGEYEDYTFYCDMDDSYTMTPAFKFFKQLDQQYPNSKFILNTRSKDNWLKSRLRHDDGQYLERHMDYYQESQQQTIERWSKEWDRHHTEVTTYFSDRPKDLLVFDIETDLPKKLVKFLPTLKLHHQLFPHANNTGESKIIEDPKQQMSLEQQ